MQSNTSILPLAAQDLRNIHDWYEKQKPDLGKEFTAAALEQFENLQTTIIVHRIFFSNVRYVPLKRFPYSIFYISTEESKDVIIVAVLGNKQDQLSIIKNRV